MSAAEKLDKTLLEAMGGGVDQMTDGDAVIPTPAESSVVAKVLEEAKESLAAVSFDISADNRPLTPSIFPAAASAMMGKVAPLGNGFVEGDLEKE